MLTFDAIDFAVGTVQKAFDAVVMVLLIEMRLNKPKYKRDLECTLTATASLRPAPV